MLSLVDAAVDDVGHMVSGSPACRGDERANRNDAGRAQHNCAPQRVAGGFLHGLRNRA